MAARPLRLSGPARPAEEEAPKQRSSASRRQPMLDWTAASARSEADGEEITGESELPLEDVTWEDGTDGADKGADAA